jgi:glycosyltransferase involved in cell wall biosynthesis
MDTHIKYTFKTITYGRVSLLEEAIFSFLNQEDSEDAEMVIVNDYPLQTLIFEHPKIRIFNKKTIFKTIGEKENFAIENSKGEIIVVADDDDIAMPWHLSNIKKYWKENTNVLQWGNGAYYNHPNITKLCYIGNSGLVYSKKAWKQIGKSPIMNAGGDTILYHKLRELGEEGYVCAFPPDEEVSWWYRWALPVPTYHQSGGGFDVEGKPDIVMRNAAFIEQQRRNKKIPTGDIELKPHWKKDYTKMLKDYARRIHNTNIR